MKKTISMFLCVALMLSLSVTAFAETPDNSVSPNSIVTWYITKNATRIRASENGTILGLVNEGDTFTNHGVSSNTAGGIEWREVTMTSGQNTGVYGFVSKGATAWKLF